MVRLGANENGSGLTDDDRFLLAPIPATRRNGHIPHLQSSAESWIRLANRKYKKIQVHECFDEVVTKLDQTMKRIQGLGSIPYHAIPPTPVKGVGNPFANSNSVAAGFLGNRCSGFGVLDPRYGGPTVTVIWSLLDPSDESNTQTGGGGAASTDKRVLTARRHMETARIIHGQSLWIVECRLVAGSVRIPDSPRPATVVTTPAGLIRRIR